MDMSQIDMRREGCASLAGSPELYSSDRNERRFEYNQGIHALSFARSSGRKKNWLIVLAGEG